MPATGGIDSRVELEVLKMQWQSRGLPDTLNIYKRVNPQRVISLPCRIASDPRILNVVEGILGPDILIYGVEYFIKEPRSAQIVAMHQDLTYGESALPVTW